MPWEPVTVEQQRREFVMLAQQETVPFRELCRRFGISPRIGLYRWKPTAANDWTLIAASEAADGSGW